MFSVNAATSRSAWRVRGEQANRGVTPWKGHMVAMRKWWSHLGFYASVTKLLFLEIKVSAIALTSPKTRHSNLKRVMDGVVHTSGQQKHKNKVINCPHTITKCHQAPVLSLTWHLMIWLQSEPWQALSAQPCCVVSALTLSSHGKAGQPASQSVNQPASQPARQSLR